MKPEDFDNIVQSELSYCWSLLSTKGEEYNEGKADRLESFKKAAIMQNCTPLQALAGMMCKHTASIYDMCDAGWTEELSKWQEKITDHINYLLILWALVHEKFPKRGETDEIQ